MIQVIDSHKLDVRDTACNYSNPDDLRREGKVFFIGGNLPIYSTLETMYESYCQESSELFHITFGDNGLFEHNLEMVRQIKRNFSIRLMGRIDYPLTASQVERVYLAGLDILDIPHKEYGSYPGIDAAADTDRDRRRIAFNSAATTFTRWSVVSSIIAGQATPHAVRDSINKLLSKGVIPLLEITGENSVWNAKETRNLFNVLAAEWHRHRVPLKALMPLLRLTTPFACSESPGFLRGVIDKLRDRRILVASDLRRHLRTSGAEASFESAGL